MDIIIGNMEILKKDTFRKAGASKADIRMIADLYASGRSLEQISVAVNVQEAVVRSFLPPVDEMPTEMEIEAPVDEMPTEMEIEAPVAPVEAEKQPSGFFKTKKKKR